MVDRMDQNVSPSRRNRQVRNESQNLNFSNTSMRSNNNVDAEQKIISSEDYLKL